jgi:prophage antirepressor-like protein
MENNLAVQQPVSASMQEVMREFEGCRFIVKGQTFDVVAKDVAVDILGLVWKGAQSIEGVPADWKGVTQKRTLNNIEEILTLSEQGLYKWLARSDSPNALPFWECVK